MWALSVYLVGLISIAMSEPPPFIERSLPEGVTSKGFNVVYGDDEMTMFNHVKSDKEIEIQKKANLNSALPPLPSEDVKCLMSVDRYCSKKMGQIKSVLIKAVKEDCKTCTDKQKEQAGMVAASMMAHDPVAWKTFLTRYEGQHRVQRILG